MMINAMYHSVFLSVWTILIVNISASLEFPENSIDLVPLSNSESCLPWTTFNTAANQCECNRNILNGIVECIDQGHNLSVSLCTCISFNNDSQTVLVGNCIFTCYLYLPDPYLKVSESHHVSISHLISVYKKLETATVCAI